MKLTIQERNALLNKYARECSKYDIGSPYRIKEYCELRIKGWSEEKAIEKVRAKK